MGVTMGKQLSRETLGDFKVALTNALRTLEQRDAHIKLRFIELRAGIIALLSTSVNHLLTGRRGVGKSTNLAVLQQTAEETGTKVIFVDVESHKERAYPDVLIEIMLDILVALRPRVFSVGKKWTVRRKMKKLVTVLEYLRDAGPAVTHEAQQLDEGNVQGSILLSGSIAKKFASLAGSWGRSSLRKTSRSTSTSYTKSKEQFLRDLAPAMSDALSAAASLESAGVLLLVLDDFYMIEKANQPLVLDHLHGITKRSRVWLKIASVSSRTQTFVNGDPPIGMQPPGDLQPLSLDLGLADFNTAKSFLEAVLTGVLRDAGFELSEVLTDTARERAVLVAGGAVCRDYFTVLIEAADVAWDRAQGRGGASDSFKIDAESVQSAAGNLYEGKLADLKSDAGIDAPALESRLTDLVGFVRDRNTFFVLVRRDQLDTDWGREIVQLEDLKFIHRIMTTRPNTDNWRGIDTVVYMIDIPALVKSRMRKAPISFWLPGESDKLRRAGWVYQPDWSPARASGREPDQTLIHEGQLDFSESLFDG